ncbi:membrane protein, putative [Pseudooceanicola batsensis HTCC2597]|uniref:Membrane protein, putative n=1 Tax=Pseudooceanicola batsensis (strain ATCC BAA-863 / DSM 15984 / KCTC 12145 / HTCC2597) TaxID=252305 RepID=A3TTU4_PSEBH|nr:ceramidase domain-containing protein [Pseudooceanicola batsensis]EAQ05071.1 membrane protein, putative [Pseudooceanicola batsensis HTCC2597]
MDRSQTIDAYCERLGPEIWAEPWNAVTNLAFLLAALIVWRRADGLVPPRVLAVLLFAIGIGSGLWHTLAIPWTGAADVLPILLFVLTYIYFANRHYWRLSPAWATGATLLFLPYAAATVPLFSRLPGLGSSAAYAPIPLLIFGYAVALRHRLPAVARGLAAGAAILCLSILFRSLDDPLCGQWPRGTHYLWHLLNALMLGWMAEVLRRHLAGGGGGR